jgi:DNA-binding NarL/FixJ family response regulator
MDRSKLSAAIPGVQFQLVADADVVIVDLARSPAIADLRASHPTAKIVAYGSHVDSEAMAAARAAGADDVMPRSKFFRDPAATLH